MACVSRMPAIASRLLTTLLLFTLVACDGGSSGSQLSVEASSYLSAALDTMAAHHVDRKEVGWSSLRKRTRKRADGAETPDDTYGAIRFALDKLDNHSSFRPPWKTSTQGTDGPVGPNALRSKNTEASSIQAKRLSNHVGYVSIPAFSGGQQASVAFADGLQKAIERTDSTTVCGWVVDLRENSGGNMWPMLAGIGPVVGEGHLGSFLFPDKGALKWLYEEGASVYRGNEVVSISGTPYELYRPSPPVAVLISKRTASSGEAMAVAFQGRNRTRTFGRSTGGFTTARSVFQLRDGAKLNLAVATFADRTGRVYGGPISPDVRPDGSTVETAQQWIRQHPACQGGA